MGKEKGQRIKGNMAPAASSKAAELLKGSQPPSFGFGSSSSIASSSGFGSFIDDYSSLDPLLQVSLKKLSKRDSITKSKALDEILGILKGDSTLIESLISVWDPLFNKLVIDVDRKVRESAMLVHLEITKSSSKKLAPILKNIIGAWILARFDVSKEVSNLAKDSFNACFSRKTEQVLVHCQHELLEYLKNNILEQTVESMSDARYTSPEDMTAKYSRTVASSFDALSFVLETISSENRRLQSDQYDTLMVNKRLWEHANHSNPFIRSAVYRMIKIMILNAPQLVSLSIDNVANSFLSKCFGEKDSDCYTFLWDAVLLLTKDYPEAWRIASEKKPVIKKVFSCLAEGIYGSGKTSYPCVLPLIAHLPGFIRDGYFFENFFVNFWKGNEKLDRFSGPAFIDAYYECCQYLIKSSSNVNSLITIDFLRPIESLLNGKLSKIPKDVVINSFLKYSAHISTSSDESIILSFENALCTILEKSLLSDNYHSGTMEYLAKGLLKADFIPKNFFTRLLPILLKQASEGKDTSADLLILILENDIPYSQENQESLYEFVAHELNTKSLKFPLLLKVTIKILIVIYGTYSTQCNVLWKNLIQLVLKDSDFESVFQIVIEMIENDLVNIEFLDPIIELDEFLKQKVFAVNDTDKNLMFKSLLLMNRSIALIQKDTLKFIFEFFKKTINEISTALYIIPSKPLDVSLYQNSYSLLTAVQSILKNSSTLPLNAFTFVIENFFFFVQLSLCDPTILSSFMWETSSDLNIIDSINQLRGIAESIISLVPEKNAEVNPSIGSLLGHIWNESFSNINHCGSPIDFIEELKILFKVSDSAEYQSRLWKEILKTPNEWQEMSIPYFSKQASSMSLADPMLLWISVYPSPLVEEHDILYDHDGLSCYSRHAVLLLGILKDKDFAFPDDCFWLIHELLRFQFICQDSLFKESPSPFADDLMVHAKRIESDIDELLSRLSISQISDFELIMKSIRNDDLNTFYSSSLLYSFSKAVLSQNQSYIQICDNRIFGCLFGREIQKHENHFSSFSTAALGLLKKKQYFLVSSLLLNHKSTFQAADFQDVFQYLTKIVTSSTSKKMENSDQLYSLITLCHFFYSFGDDSSAVVTNQDRTSLLRWIRSFYDAKISKSPIVIDQSPFDVMIDALLGFLLSLVLKDVNNQSADIGLSMSNFVTNLSVYWFNQLAISDVTEVSACLLFYTCKIWGCLQKAVDEDPESWQRVADVENDIEDLLLDIFVTIGQPKLLSTSGFAVLQTYLAEMVMEFPHADFIEFLIPKEPMIYDMYFTKNEMVRNTAYALAKVITAKRVHDLSVAIEMQTADSQIVFLKDSLVKGLQYQFKDETDQVGFLLSWLSLLDHFIDATFDLRQYYTNHLRELNVLNRLFETIFDILNVNSANKEPFNLEKWEFEEYMIEGLDSSSESSIPLLCAHIYYRSLKSIPGLVRLWFSECKSRQFVIAVENFTEKFFSPLLLSSEIKAVQKLIDNDMSIKVNPKTYDITASYTFEEAELDIIIKMPSCFPLKLVEVSSGSGGGRMAGISDARWRGWLLAVSSIMIGHNGSVADALAQFKKNVSMHFEGIEDCAICYSVISLADRSTPQKSCRVCKHVFHGSCLYKWFKSSNQNHCPLCRQPI